MRRTAGLLAGTASFLIVLGLGDRAVAGPSPATPSQTIQCFDEEEDGNLYRTCYESRGVLKGQGTPSGHVTYVSNGRLTVTHYVDGQLVSYGKSALHLVGTGTMTAARVVHLVARKSTTNVPLSVTCTFDSMSTMVNGELRRDVFDSECTAS